MSTEETRALLAWCGATRSAQAVLVEAARFCDGGATEGGVHGVLAALRQLECKIEGHLAAESASTC